MQSLVKPVLLSVISLAVLSGCRSLTPPLENPMLVDYQAASAPGTERDFGTTALTASRRMVLFKLKDHDFQKICAEPPPSVGEQVTSAFQAALSAEATKDAEKPTAEAKVNLARSLATSLTRLEKPKGIQYEQDLLYSLCQLHMNNALHADQVAQFYQMIAARAERLLLEEIRADRGKEATLNEGDLITSRRVLKAGAPLEMTLADNPLFDAYHSAQVIVRQVTPKASRIEFETGDWKVLATVTPDRAGKISLPFEPDKTGVAKDQATLLQAGIRLQRKQGFPVDYQSSGHFVYYGGDSGQAKVELKPADKPLGPDGVQLAVQLPKLFQYAYPGLLADMALKATSLLGDTPVQFKAKALESETEAGKLLWQLRLEDEALRNKLAEARKKAAVPLELSLIRPAQADAPTLATLHFSLLPKAKPVSGTHCERQTTNGNVLVTWAKPEGSVTQYLVKRWLNTAPTEIENTKTYAANSLQQTRFDIPAGELKTGTSYGLRVKAVNDYGEAEDSAAEVCNFDIPKPAEAKQ